LRLCMFCRGRASSKEDALPLWLVRRLPTPNGVYVEAERGRNFTKRWKAAKHDLKVRFVCKACNNGWMSRLENRAKPIVEAIFDRAISALSPTDQATLAEWAVKVSMVLEALRSGTTWFYSQEERALMRGESAIPPRTRVWLAKCVNLPGTYCASSDLSETPSQGAQEAKAYVTTIAFRDLALQVVTARAPERAPTSATLTTDVRPGPWSQVTVSMWPPSAGSLAWPPPLGLDGEAGLAAVIDRWRPGESS